MAKLASERCRHSRSFQIMKLCCVKNSSVNLSLGPPAISFKTAKEVIKLYD